jgi:hypothetical protein
LNRELDVERPIEGSAQQVTAAAKVVNEHVDVQPELTCNTAK